MHLEDYDASAPAAEANLADRWIISRYNRCALEVTKALEEYDMGLAASRIYEFLWDELCDWYIEIIKPRLYGRETPESRRRAQKTLAETLNGTLTLLHPFMPFITEELWQHLPHRGESIMLAPWPAGDAAKLDEGAEEALSLVMEVVKACRNLRTQVNVGPGKKAALVLLSDSETSQATLEACRGYMMSLATAENITIGPAGGEKPRQAVTAVVRGVEVYLPLAGLVDMDKERQRLEKEIQKVQGEISGTEKKLSNEGFRAKAPAEVIAKEEAKLLDARYRLQALQARLAVFGG